MQKPQDSSPDAGLNRRSFLKAAGLIGLAGMLPGSMALAQDSQDTVTLPFVNGERRMVAYPQKRKLILQTARPPQLETPFAVFNEGILTPNDAFYVRYHLAGIPTSIDADSFRVKISGNATNGKEFSIADLKSQFEPVELVAVLQCSGNSRGFSNPRVGGGQSGNGAMGNARWKGARLKDVLGKCGVGEGSKQVTFNGMDFPVMNTTPDFVKALDLDHAMDGDVMLAYEMNGQDLPWLNGYPLRLIVPGYYGTYWVKHVNDIQVVKEDLENFWMKSAYRIPDNAGHCLEPGTKMGKSVPINRYDVRSFITSLADGAKLKKGEHLTVRGIAFDGGYGIQEVVFSSDGGESWHEAKLGEDLGKYSFREWTIPFTPKKKGNYSLKVKATNRIGQSQPLEALWNPSGYMRNVVETVNVTVS